MSLPIPIDSCGHDLKGSGIHLIVQTEGEDWNTVVAGLRARKVTMAGFYRQLREVSRAGKDPCVRICDACSDELPSTKANAARQATAYREKEEATTSKRAEKIRAAAASGTTLYECPGCEELLDEDDLVQLRECPHCESTFDGTDNGRNCPECNRPFSRKLADAGCAECLDGDDLPYPYKKEESKGETYDDNYKGS